MNKNKLLLFLVMICLFLVTGCSEKIQSGEKVDSDSNLENSNGTLICTRAATAQEGVSVDLSYEVKYSHGNIDVLHSIEKINTTNEEILSTYEEAYKKIFQRYEDLKYYDNLITRDEKSVISDTTIYYNKVDLVKLKELENADTSVIKNGKVSLKDWLEFAEKFGTTCYEK